MNGTTQLANHKSEGFFTLVGDLQDDLKRLIKKEIDLAKTEMGEKFSALGKNAGLAAAGTVYGVLAAGLRVRETLFPLLVLPVVAPVMLGATRAWEAALDGVPSEAWPWVQLLGVFGVIYIAIGWLAFGPLLEET